MNLQDALSALSAAHGARALANAFALVQGQVRRARAASRQQFGTLAQTFTAAMQIWDQQKADGVSRSERLIGLEQSLRAAWPQTREWKYLCGECADHGLVMHACDGDSACGRYRPHLPHEYGTPCWCSNGAKFREKPKPTAEDYTAAGKSKPMAKVGRG